MPVLIAAQKADVDIARAVAKRLRAAGGEVRCYLEDDDHELREMGCKVAVGLLDDSYNLAGALTNVHTFMALLPDALTWPDPKLLEEAGIAWAAAAEDADIEQTIIALSRYGDTFAAVQSAFEQKCDPLGVIRTGLLVGPERPLKPGMGPTAVAVPVDELAEILACADDREELAGQWGLDGWPIQVQSSSDLPLPEVAESDNSAADAFFPAGRS